MCGAASDLSRWRKCDCFWKIFPWQVTSNIEKWNIQICEQQADKTKLSFLFSFLCSITKLKLRSAVHHIHSFSLNLGIILSLDSEAGYSGLRLCGRKNQNYCKKGDKFVDILTEEMPLMQVSLHKKSIVTSLPSTQPAIFGSKNESLIHDVNTINDLSIFINLFLAEERFSYHSKVSGSRFEIKLLD